MLAIETKRPTAKQVQSKSATSTLGLPNSRVLSDVVSQIGIARYAAAHKQFPGLVEDIVTICEKSTKPSSEAILNGLNGANSAAGVITSSALFYLPMSTVPFGQKLIALGPGGCGAFEQISHKNYDQYYGWFPMPKVPADNPIRMQFKGQALPIN